MVGTKSNKAAQWKGTHLFCGTRPDGTSHGQQVTMLESLSVAVGIEVLTQTGSGIICLALCLSVPRRLGIESEDVVEHLPESG